MILILLRGEKYVSTKNPILSVLLLSVGKSMAFRRIVLALFDSFSCGVCSFELCSSPFVVVFEELAVG